MTHIILFRRTITALTLLLTLTYSLYSQPTLIGVEKLPGNQLGNILRNWAISVNSGDPQHIRSMIDSSFSANAFKNQRSAKSYAAYFQKLYEQSGGLDVISYSEPTGPQPGIVIVKARKSGRFARITADLDISEPNKFAGLGVDSIEEPTLPLTEPSKILSDNELVASITQLIDDRSKRGLFSGVILIAKNEQIMLHKAFGFSDREQKKINSTATTFHLASIGKMFTAVAIAQLVNAKKISFDDKVADVLPAFPNKEIAEKVTIKQLLTHTGGLGTFFESPGFNRSKIYQNATHEIEVYKDEALFFEPGTRWRYSNAGYSLLAAIIEKQSGISYSDYIERNIFRPLGMKNTYKTANATGSASVFYTQSPDDPLGLEPFLGDRDLSRRYVSGFGGGFSNSTDMFRFLRAYRTGKLLGNDLTTELYKTNVSQGKDSPRKSAFGLVEYEVNGETIRGHIGGSRTEVEMLWESGYTVIILTNQVPPTVQTVSGPIIKLLTSQEMISKKSLSLK